MGVDWLGRRPEHRARRGPPPSEQPSATGLHVPAGPYDGDEASAAPTVDLPPPPLCCGHACWSMSDRQYLQTFASALMISAQKGHLRSASPIRSRLAFR